MGTPAMFLLGRIVPLLLEQLSCISLQVICLYLNRPCLLKGRWCMVLGSWAAVPWLPLSSDRWNWADRNWTALLWLRVRGEPVLVEKLSFGEAIMGLLIGQQLLWNPGFSITQSERSCLLGEMAQCGLRCIWDWHEAGVALRGSSM